MFVGYELFFSRCLGRAHWALHRPALQQGIDPFLDHVLDGGIHVDLQSSQIFQRVPDHRQQGGVLVQGAVDSQDQRCHLFPNRPKVVKSSPHHDEGGQDGGRQYPQQQFCFFLHNLYTKGKKPYRKIWVKGWIPPTVTNPTLQPHRTK